MLLTRACLALAVVETSAQNYDLPPSMQVPEMQYQPPPAADPLASMSLPEMQYQPAPDMQMMYQQVPDMQMMYGSMPSTELPVTADLQTPPQAKPPVKPDDGSEECQMQQAANPLHTGMSVLELGRVYCSQAADSRWWDVVVKSRNCDGSYAVVVKDDVGTEWPVTQRAYFLDKPCNDFYRDVLKEEGLSDEEIRATLHSQGFKEDGQQQEVLDHSTSGQEPHTATPMQEVFQDKGKPVDTEKQKSGSRWPVSEKKFPVKVIAAAAAAGAVPLVYTLSGS